MDYSYCEKKRYKHPHLCKVCEMRYLNFIRLPKVINPNEDLVCENCWGEAIKALCFGWIQPIKESK